LGLLIIPLIANPFSVSPIVIALKYIKLSKDRKNTTMNQYTFGIKRFMEASLDGFLNN
jgi:ABC-type sulfate transport system permease subunit